MGRIIVPQAVRPDSKVALIGPASRIKAEITADLVRLYKERNGEFPCGELIVYPSALEENAEGSYAASLQQRMSDFRDAWERDDVDMVICARGGYGCVHMLDHLDADFISAHPKWLVGFSDVSALHALLYKCGVASIHGGMAKQLVENTEVGGVRYRDSLRSIVERNVGSVVYRSGNHEYNVYGEGHGVLLGGNLAVLNGLAGTRYDLMAESLVEDTVLFIEDVSEPIYAVERMLYRLHLQGVLSKVMGVVIGQFTEWRPDRNHDTMYEMIHDRLVEWGIGCPVVFDFPIGHSDSNVPLVEGVPCSIRCDENGGELRFEI